jgi:4-alpha-glucanotransferase
MSFSAFGGNPLLISPERLVKDDFLAPADLEHPPSFPSDRVDYGLVGLFKSLLLVKSFQRFRSQARGARHDEFASFCHQHAFWLEDYALFMALKEGHANDIWTRWEEGLARRDDKGLEDCSRRLKEKIQFHKFVQYLFFTQWASVKAYCREQGVRIIGDMPIYVAHDSADVWVHRELFHLDDSGNPTVIAGVPPDYFSATGQRWGNPIFHWDVIARSEYQWWIDRFRMNLSLVDIIRLDHFRGFEAYWEIPAEEPAAINGRWVKGPGADFFNAMQNALGELPVIAEDLGVITPEVDALRDQFGFPGMRVLQMAFGNDPKAPEYRPENHIQNCVVYTATHDHNTTVGWFTAEAGKETTQTKEEVEEERANVVKYLGTEGREIHWDFIRLALDSVANTAILPLQDVLGLGSKHRMNRPGTAHGNWEWRFDPRMLTLEVEKKLRELTLAAGRDTQ